jgi:hypothetical protein
VVKEILAIFGKATGLRTNLAKCSITPIFSGEDTGFMRKSSASSAIKFQNQSTTF